MSRWGRWADSDRRVGRFFGYGRTPPMPRVNFAHAFERWYQLTERERAYIEKEDEKDPATSWVALDHLCGLAVESGMKALLFHGNLVTPDSKGDYPPTSSGRRPHVDELFAVFLSKVQGRSSNEWLRTLTGGKGPPPLVFNSWKSEHRYAPDNAVDKTIVKERLSFAKRLRALIRAECAA